MMDEIDSLLSRALKNWTASHPAPPNNREQLLERASQLRAAMKWNMLRGIDYDFRGAEDFYHPGNWLTIPFSQSRLYSFHISTVFRMAT